MAVSIALNSSSLDITADTGSKTSGSLASRIKSNLLKRAKQVGDSLRKPEDILFLGASVGAGLGAKSLAVWGLGFVGITAGGAGLLAGAAIAIVGGATAGLAKEGVKYYRDVKAGKDVKFWTSKTFKSVAVGTAISALTFGANELSEFATGDNLIQNLGKLFNKAAEHLPGKLFALVPGTELRAQTLNLPQPVATIPASAPVSAPSIDAVSQNLPEPVQIIPAAEAPAPVANTALPKAFADIPATSAPVAPVADAAPDLPKPVATVPATPVAEPVAAKVAVPTPATLDTGVYAGPHKTLDNNIRERAFAKLRALNPFSKAALDAAPSAAPAVTPDVQPVGVTSQPPISADKIVNVADLAKADLNGVDPHHIVVKTGAGVEVRMPAEPDLKAELRAANVAINTENAQNASSGLPAETYLEPEKMAGSCVSDLPATQAEFQAQSQTLPTNCAVASGKLNMNAGDYVTIRDGNGGRIRAAFSQIAQRTSSFMTKVVPLEVKDMMNEKMVSATPAP